MGVRLIGLTTGHVLKRHTPISASDVRVPMVSGEGAFFFHGHRAEVERNDPWQFISGAPPKNYLWRRSI